MNNKHEVIVKCQDNCGCMSVDYWDDDDNEYFITFYNSYEDTRIITKIKDIWKIIRGKRIYNSELVLSEKDFNKIRNFTKKDTFHGL